MRAYALLGGPTDLWPQDIKEQLLEAKRNHELISVSIVVPCF